MADAAELRCRVERKDLRRSSRSKLSDIVRVGTSK